jgi:hypothetical protein
MRIIAQCGPMLCAIPAGLVLWLSPIDDAVPQVKSCVDACYRAKSGEYQRCRIVPPSERAKRAACFERADQALKRCLRACQGPSPK